jgi:hypothetical protein
MRTQGLPNRPRRHFRRRISAVVVTAAHKFAPHARNDFSAQSILWRHSYRDPWQIAATGENGCNRGGTLSDQ